MTPRAPRWMHVVMVPTVIVLLVPLYFLVVNAIKPQDSIIRDPFGSPWDKLTLQPLIDALGSSNGINVRDAYLTTAIVTIGSVGLTLVLASMFAYVVARARSRWATVAFLVVITGLLIPSQVILLPAIQVLRATNLMFTMPGLLLTNASQYLAFATFVYVGFIRRIPRELDESARVDGAGPFVTYRRIDPSAPPSRHGVLGGHPVPLGVERLPEPAPDLGPSAGYTITSGIYRALGQYTTDWEQVFAFLWLFDPAARALRGLAATFRLRSRRGRRQGLGGLHEDHGRRGHPTHGGAPARAADRPGREGVRVARPRTHRDRRRSAGLG